MSEAKKPLRFILAGLGNMGSYWCKHTIPHLTGNLGLEFAAAVDVNEAAYHSAITAGVAPEHCYTDLRKALERHEADFVINVVPPALHEDIVDAALEYGCDILSEKPIADSMEASCRIYRKVTAAGRKMSVTMSHRFDQDKQTLERLIRSGKYGALDSIVGKYAANFRRFASWGKFRHEMADPLLIEGAIHHFDILRSLAGSDPKTIYAKTWKADWGQYAGDCNALVICEMVNGVKTFFEGSNTPAAATNGWSQEYFRAECEFATLELDRREVTARSTLGFPHPERETIPLAKQPVWMNTWLAELFVDWVRGGDEPPNSLKDNLQCTAMLFAAIESARTGREIDVQAFLREHM